MSIRVHILNGNLVPLDPWPPEWVDGRMLQLEDANVEPSEFHANGVASPAPLDFPDDDGVWLTDDEYERFKAAIEEADREAKAWVRREMGID
jgi:hypothetical protein